MAAKSKKKIVDKWKLKKWYDIIAPAMFQNKVIGEAVAIDENSMMNRIIEVGSGELGIGAEEGRRSFSTIKVKLRVIEVKGKQAHTKYIGHQTLQSYLKTLARRGRSVMDVVLDVETKDGEKFRFKTIIISANTLSQNTKKNLRHAAKEAILEAVPQLTAEEVIMETLNGKLSGKVYSKIKQITRIMKVEIKKLERAETFR
ncbi:MAG: hypothetical protein WC501_01300 [Candidatus Micrarchaeia archaeon]